MGRIIRTTLRRTLGQVRHVSPVRPNAATGLVADVYADVEADFGMLAPPIALHSPAPAALAAAWTMLRETLVAQGLSDRATREAVAAAVSRSNDCPYCVKVHSATLGGLTTGSADARAYRQVEAWADRSSGTRPFASEQLPELLGVATTFHYLNRMVNVFLVDSPLPAGAPAPARRFLGRYMGVSARREHPPGTSLRRLEHADLPADLAWAAGNPVVADAFARVAKALDAGARVLPADARDLVSARIAEWDGTPPGISRGWASEAVEPLPRASRPAAALALLVAFASYQVDDSTITAAKLNDRELVELTSWASFTAARRMAALTHATHRSTEV